MENQTKTKLTLNPEEEKQSNILLEGVPVRQTVQPIVQTQTEYNAENVWNRWCDREGILNNVFD